MMRTKTSLTLILVCFFTFIHCQPPPRRGPHPGFRNGLPPPPKNSRPPHERFRIFHQAFRRPYRHGSPEYLRRYAAFLENVRRIDALNKLRIHNDSATYGITKFSDLTLPEFQEKYLSGLHPVNHTNILTQTHLHSDGIHKLTTSKISSNSLKYQPSLHRLPPKVDWRNRYVLTPVRDQKACGGCWAFSVVEMLESLAAIASGKLVPLSVQEVIDCINTLWGCKGGDTHMALAWLMKTQTPLVPSSEYPLTDKAESCHLPNNTKHGVTIKNYTTSDLAKREDILQKYISEIGPVSVSVDATTWTNYLGGIIQFHCGENPNNHAVLIVGYDKTGDIPYYIVKNSWGKDFGDNGYVYIAMGDNVCGIGHEVSIASVNL